MRICPTCGDLVASTLRRCPRCAAPPPDPGGAAESWTGAEPWTGHGTAPRSRPAPGYLAEPGYLPPLEYGAGPGNLPPPEYHTGSGRYPPGPAQPAGYQGAPYLPTSYLPVPAPPADYLTAPYQPGPDEPARHQPDWYGQAPYEDDPDQPGPFGDSFAGGPETGGFPALSSPEPGPEAEAGPERAGTAPRLLHGLPGRLGQPPGRRAQIASAVLAAVALLAGGISAWTVFGGHQASAPGARLAGRQTTPTHPAGPAAPSSPPPAAAPGAAVVTMAPGVSQAPDAAQVDGVLVSYFTAINTHSYQQYVQLLIPARRAQLTGADFAHGYGTTADSGATIVGISATGTGVAATVTFTSRQRSAADPGVTSCTYWDITLYLQKQSGSLLIGNPPPSYHAYHHACP